MRDVQTLQVNGWLFPSCFVHGHLLLRGEGGLTITALMDCRLLADHHTNYTEGIHISYLRFSLYI